MWSAFVRAWRSWAAAPGVALLAIAALAIGIGSATAIYTVVNTIVLRPFAYWDTNRYFALYGGSLTVPDRRGSHTFGSLIEYQQRTHSFDVFGWLKPGSYNLVYGGEPQYITGVAETPSLVTGLSVPPTLGTWFSDDSGVVLADTLWRRLG
jgi:putative ABC transport system permease protein